MGEGGKAVKGRPSVCLRRRSSPLPLSLEGRGVFIHALNAGRTCKGRYSWVFVRVLHVH